MKKYLRIITAGLSCLMLFGCSANGDIIAVESKLSEIQKNLEEVERDNKELSEKLEWLEKRIVEDVTSAVPETKPKATPNPNPSLIVTQPIASTDTQIKQEPSAGQFYSIDRTDPSNPHTSVEENYALKTNNNKILFNVPDNAVNVIVAENQLSYEMINEWFQVKHSYQVNTNIKSAPKCELQIKEITKNLPLSLDKNYDPLFFLQDLPDNYYYYQNGGLEQNDISMDDVWYIIVSEHGAAYFYESSKFTDGNLLYDTMIQESFDYIDGVAIHGQIEIQDYNFKSYYNSLATNIEKNEADRTYKTTMGKFLRSNQSLTYTYGFDNCLMRHTQLKGR